MKKRFHLKSKIVLLSFISIVFLMAPSLAQSAEIPKIILNGIEAYKNQSAEAAIQTWLKGSPLENDKNALSQSNLLLRIESFYGKIVGFNLIEKKKFSENSTIYYLEMRHEAGPVFAKFLTYKTKKGTIIVSFDLNTKPEAVFPQKMLSSKN